MCQHLWSVLSAEVKKRQSSNPNNTIIDIADKAKQLLSIITTDKKERRKGVLFFMSSGELYHRVTPANCAVKD